MLNSALIMILTIPLFAAAMAANHEIGDGDGWSAAGTVDYTNWASTKNIFVGDRLDFKYNHQFHDVLEVSRQDFESCNSSSPIVTYATGSVNLTAAGHHYFLCSSPGHCGAGQKLHIIVHCDADVLDPIPPHHRSNSPPFFDSISFIQVVLCCIVWQVFV